MCTVCSMIITLIWYVLLNLVLQRWSSPRCNKKAALSNREIREDDSCLILLDHLWVETVENWKNVRELVNFCIMLLAGADAEGGGGRMGAREARAQNFRPRLL